jgi:hypothetical protein
VAVRPVGAPGTVAVGVEVDVNWSAELVAEVPEGVVTVTFTVPTDSGGLTAVIWVAFLTVPPVAAVDPKWTALAPVKLVPVTVTDVPPPVVPEVGLILVTVGTATAPSN